MEETINFGDDPSHPIYHAEGWGWSYYPRSSSALTWLGQHSWSYLLDGWRKDISKRDVLNFTLLQWPLFFRIWLWWVGGIHCCKRYGKRWPFPVAGVRETQRVESALSQRRRDDEEWIHTGMQCSRELYLLASLRLVGDDSVKNAVKPSRNFYSIKQNRCWKYRFMGMSHKTWRCHLFRSSQTSNFFLYF